MNGSVKWDKFRDINTGNEKEPLEFIFVHMDTEYRCEGGVYQEYNPGNFEKILKTLKMNEEIIGIYGVEEEKRDFQAELDYRRCGQNLRNSLGTRC